MDRLNLNEDIKNVLKYHQLQDLIPNIESMTYREERQKQKIYDIIHQRVIEALMKYIDLEYLNIEKMCQKFCDLFVRNYGLFFADFIERYGEEIKKCYNDNIDEYDEDMCDAEKIESMVYAEHIKLTHQKIDEKHLMGPMYELVDAKDVFRTLIGYHKSDDINDVLDFYGLLIDMGEEEGFYNKSGKQTTADAFYNYLHKYINS